MREERKKGITKRKPTNSAALLWLVGWYVWSKKKTI